MQPPILPKNIFKMLSWGIAPWCIAARGVAVDTASAPGATQFVISTGQLNINALAASAGLTMFLPIPPKSCLTIMIAKKSPTRTHQQGMVGGHTKAMSMPVTIADRSYSLEGLFSKAHHAHSKNTQPATLIRVTSSARRPKKYTLPISAGNSAISTSRMMVRVLTGVWTWGELEMVSS